MHGGKLVGIHALGTRLPGVVLGVSLGTGLSGVFVAGGDGRGWATSSSLAIAFALTLGAAVTGMAAAGRLPERLPGAG